MFQGYTRGTKEMRPVPVADRYKLINLNSRSRTSTADKTVTGKGLIIHTNMHGRLKVKTTAEQQEAKRKEREKRLQAWKAGMTKVFQKRQEQNLDEEALAVSSELLAANPDVYTLWNIRREILSEWKEKRCTEELQKVHDNELQFLEGCLRMNPKSYGTWHHREWVLDHMNKPDWMRELQLCNKFLEYDERNFHCWDFRRIVVGKASVSPQDEFDFTNNKITTNFSNYSSWHYRSKLLPLIRPDPSHPVGVEEETLLQEFELVQNAFFTDPSDQSAWFYHRWLLGRKERPLSLEALRLSRRLNRVLIVLSKPAQFGVDFELDVTMNDNVSKLEWQAAGSDFCAVWTSSLDLPEDQDVQVCVTMRLGDEVNSQSCSLAPACPSDTWRQTYKQGTKFSYELSAAALSILVTELESCQQLHDLEPDNKWALLTIVSLMRAIDPLKYDAETRMYLDKLIHLDSKRTSYYTDLRSKYIIENCIELLEENAVAIDLSSKGLTCLTHLDQLVTMDTIDLSNNDLTSLGADCQLLQCVRSLKLDDNRLGDLQPLAKLNQLEELHLRHNRISNADELKPLALCASLKKVILAGNPICGDKDVLETALPGIQIVS